MLDWLYPPRCCTCRRAWNDRINPCCPSCQALLKDQASNVCPRCAEDRKQVDQNRSDCGACRNASFTFERVLRLGEYQGALQQAVLQIKQASNEAMAYHLGRLWWLHQQELGHEANWDVIVPIPIHWTRRVLRGYNHAEAIAQGIAHGCARKANMHVLRKRRITHRQSELTVAQRQQNMIKAFTVVPSARIKGKGILLVDDVVTTGSTAQSATRELKKAGADRVIIACLARSHKD